MRYVKIKSIEYACPFEKMFRPLNSAESLALREAAKTNRRFDSPVLVCTTPTWGKTLIDGVNRVLIGQEEKAAVSVLDIGPLSDDEARDRAHSLNTARRQLTPEEIAVARAERNEYIRRRAEEGATQTEIAKEIGVTQATVSNVLSSEQDSNNTLYSTGSSESSTLVSSDGSVARPSPPKVTRLKSEWDALVEERDNLRKEVERLTYPTPAAEEEERTPLEAVMTPVEFAITLAECFAAPDHNQGILQAGQYVCKLLRSLGYLAAADLLEREAERCS